MVMPNRVLKRRHAATGRVDGVAALFPMPRVAQMEGAVLKGGVVRINSAIPQIQ